MIHKLKSLHFSDFFPEGISSCGREQGDSNPGVIEAGSLKADLHGTTLSHVICLRQVYDLNRFV